MPVLIAPSYKSFVCLSVFPRLSSGGQRYVNVNSSPVSILETGTLRLRELITVQGHRENRRQSRCHASDFLSPVPFSLPSRSLSSSGSKSQDGRNLPCQVKAASQASGRKESPHPPSDHFPGGSGPQTQWARQASYRVGLTASGQQAKQKGRATGPLGKLNFIPSSLL